MGDLILKNQKVLSQRLEEICVLPSSNDEAKDHEYQDDGPCNSNHSDDNDRILLTGDGCGCKQSKQAQ